MPNYEYEYEYESEVSPHLKCDYCLHALIDPVLSSCQHQFCKNCIELALNNTRACPECEQEVEFVEPIKDPRIVKALDELVVRCKICPKRNIPREYFFEHSEIHRLNALCNQQKDFIDKLQDQVSSWQNKYEAASTEQTEKITSIALKFIYNVERNYEHRYACMEGDPQSVVQSIEDAQHVSLVTLEQAIEPLDTLVTGIRQMVQAVMERCEKLIGSLSLDEAASIMLFSMEAEPKEYCFYRTLNKVLQNEDLLQREPWRNYIQLLMRSLSKLPSMENETLYLGIAGHTNYQYSQGMMFTWKQFSFCATSRKNLEDVLGATGPRTIFSVNSRSGRNIRAYSCFPVNDEILLPFSIKFKVIRTEQESPDLSIIHLEEIHSIPPEYPHEACLPVSNATCDQSWQMIIDESSPSSIDLSRQGLTDEVMNIVVEKALKRRQCIVIDLGNNHITSQGVLVISNALNTGVVLKRLYLGGNPVADEGASHIGRAVCNSSLIVLGLSSCGITDRGARYLSDMLRAKHDLTVLGLEDNDIGNEGVAVLVYGLQANRRLRRLLLARNKAINDSCVDDIVNMLNGNQILQRLDLRDCSLSEKAKERLQRAIPWKRKFDMWV